MTHGVNHLLAALVHPGFLVAGLALASVPIIIHLLNRRRFKVVPWAAMEYLLAAMRQNRRRLRFERWLLLAVRCLVLALLGLALAQPMACDRGSLASLAAQRSGLHVLVIDNSYSMAYQADRDGAATHLEQAKKLAAQLVERLGDGESVAVITAGAPASAVVVPASAALDRVRAAIEQVPQSYAGTDLPGALKLALDVARTWRPDDRSLYLFTDATRSAWGGRYADELAALGPRLAEVYAIQHFNLGQKGQWNQAILSLRPSGTLVAGGLSGEGFVADIKGFGGGELSHLQWSIDQQTRPGEVALRPDEQTSPQTQLLTGMGGGVHVVSGTLRGTDRLQVDNTRWRIARVASQLKVLVVEGDRGTGALSGSAAFLSLALAPPASPDESAGGSLSAVAPERISDLELPTRVLGGYRAVMMVNVAQVQPAQADQLEHFVRGGGTLIWFMGERVQGDSYNQVLRPRGLLPGVLTKRLTVGADGEGYRFDFNAHGNVHPLLKAFEGEDKSGLDTARIFTYWQIEPAPELGVERVLNYRPRGGTTNPTTDATTDADPAITFQPLGSGHIVFVSTSADASWTSFPAKPAYLTLVHELLLGSVSSGDAWMNVQVGERLVLPDSIRLSGAPVLKDAAGKALSLVREAGADKVARYQSKPLSQPGVHHLEVDGQAMPIAVNVPPDEADVRTLDDPAILRSMGGVEMTLLGDQLPSDALASDRGMDLSWSVMMLVLVIVATESALAMRMGRTRG